jgi:rhamnosyltransferase subunit B
MIAIGTRLRQAGHDVVISLAQPYAEIAERAGLTVEPVISQQRFTEAIGNANVWKPIRGPIEVFRHIAAEYLSGHEEVIRKHHVEGETILVAHPLDLMSRVYREAQRSTPMVTVHLQPTILRTFDSPPRLSPWWFEISRPAWAIRAAYWLIDHVALDPVIRQPLNRKRAEYGLPPIRRVVNQWWLSPDRIVAMYPDWFAPATRSFCPRLVHCGFPLADISGDDFTAPDDRPIVFTSGTAHHHCREFFQRAVGACVELDRGGLLLSTFPENFPTDLPESVRTLSYVSLGQLLHHCSAIVHHGGIGTTSAALAAGIPQVVRPLAFDQFDNAARVEKLGCGRWLRRDKYLAATLRCILEPPSSLDSPRAASPASVQRTEIAHRLQDADGPALAAAEIEKLMHDRLSPTT